MTIAIQVVVKKIVVDSVEVEVETLQVLVLLEDGLEDVLVVHGVVMVTVEVVEVQKIQELLLKILKLVIQEQLVDNIKVMDTLRLLRLNNEF